MNQRVFPILIFLCVLSGSISAKSFDTLSVLLYTTSKDLYNNNHQEIDAVVLSDEIGDHFFYANKIIDRKTGKKVKDFKFIWAIKYNDGVYVNMGYMDVMTTIGMYIKFDIVGENALLIYDERMPYNRANNALSYGGGLIGHSLAKFGGHLDKNQLWSSSQGDPLPILYCNLLKEEYRNFQMKRNESCLLHFLSKKQLKKIKEKNPAHDIGDDPSLEEVFSYFSRINGEPNMDGNK